MHAPDSVAPETRKRGWGAMLSYAVPQVGGSIFLHLPALLLMPFLTNALAVPAAFAGLVIFLPKIWVVICDPLTGILSDRARRRGVPRAKLVAWGGIGMTIMLPLLFAPIAFGTPLLRGLYVLVAYLVASTIFSAFSVPYLSLASEIAADPRDRTRLLAMRQTANFTGALLANYAPALVQYFGGGRTGFGWMGVVFGGLCLATTLWVLRLRRLTGSDDATPHRLSAWQQLADVGRDRRFRLLMTAYLLQMAAVGAISAGFLYLVVYQLKGDLLLVSLIATCMTIAGLVAQPLWVLLERRIGAWSTYALCVVAMAAGDGSFCLVDADHRWLAFPVAIFVGVFSSGFAVMAWTLLLHRMSDAGARGGAQEGAYAGIWSAGEKIAIATGALLGGFVLQLTGFHSSTAGFVAQQPLALVGIKIVTSGLTAGLLLVSLLFLLRLRRITA